MNRRFSEIENENSILRSKIDSISSSYKEDKIFLEKRAMHKRLLSDASPSLSRLDPLVQKEIRNEYEKNGMKYSPSIRSKSVISEYLDVGYKEKSIFRK
jgi:hypothetical protein